MEQNSSYVYEIAMRRIYTMRIHTESMLIEEMKFSEGVVVRESWFAKHEPRLRQWKNRILFKADKLYFRF